MTILLQIEGVKTGQSVDNLKDVINIDSLQFSSDVSGAMRALSSAKPVDKATPQIFALAQGDDTKNAIFYICEDSCSEVLKIELPKARISGWSITADRDRSAEYFTVEALSVKVDIVTRQGGS